MDTPITFTVSQLIGVFLAACGLVTATAAAGAVIVALINKIKAPNVAQNARLDEHEKMLKRHEEKLLNDNNRLIRIDEEMAICLKAMLALLRHGIDGNDIESMKKVRNDLQSYLIDRKKVDV